MPNGRGLWVDKQAYVDFLFDRLHPAVFDLHGAEQCQGCLPGVIDILVQIEVLTRHAPVLWKFERDGRSIVVETAYTVQTSFLAAGQTPEQELYHALVEDGNLRLFTYCGEPLN